MQMMCKLYTQVHIVSKVLNVGYLFHITFKKKSCSGLLRKWQVDCNKDLTFAHVVNVVGEAHFFRGVTSYINNYSAKN